LAAQPLATAGAAKPRDTLAFATAAFGHPRKESDLADRVDGFVEIGCSDAAAFKVLPPAEFRKTIVMLGVAAEKVSTGTMTKTAYKQLEVMSGFTWNPYGLVASRALCSHAAPLHVVTYDWVHSALQSGTLTAEVEAILSSTSIGRAELQSFLADDSWQYPRFSATKAKALHKVFDPRRISTEDVDKLRATCSELVGLYGLLRFFFHLKLDGVAEFSEHLQSFDAVCSIIDLLLHCKRGMAATSDTARDLRAALRLHLDSHIATYGTAHLRPKHHWMQDLPEQIVRDGLVLDAFVIERTHLRVKAIAEKVANTVAFERSVLSGLLTVSLRDDSTLLDGPVLLGHTAVWPGFDPPVIVANRMMVFGFEVSVADVMLCGDAAGQLLACAQQEQEFFCIVSLLQPLERITMHVSAYRRTAERAVWRATEFAHALAWRDRPDGTVIVVQR
jgi:hypothetical protein